MKFNEQTLKTLKEAGIDVSTIEILQEIEENKQMHYWYGGDTVKIKYKDCEFYIGAEGIVTVDFLNKNTGDELFRVKDKRKSASLYLELSKYINSDEELKKVLNYEHEKYEANFENNNWWECAVVRNGEYHDLDWCLDSSTITEAIIEVFNHMESIYKDTFQQN